MACDPEILKQVPLFALLDDDETAVLAGQVELTTFAARQRIYKIGDAAERAYVMVSGAVRVTMIDEDHQDVVVSSRRMASSSGSRRCWTDAASDRRDCARGDGLHRGRSQRHHRS